MKRIARGNGKLQGVGISQTDIFRGHIIDVTDTTYTVELTGTGDKLDAFIQAVGKEPVLEVVRSGVSGVARGEKSLKV